MLNTPGKLRIGFLTQRDLRGKENGSARIRADWLIKYWPEAELYKEDQTYDVLVFQKLSWREKAQSFSGIKIYDVCDFEEIDYEMAKLCDRVTTSSRRLAGLFENAVPIPDRFDLDYFKIKKNHAGAPARAVWFGYSKNAHLLTAFLHELERRNIRLTTITDKPCEIGHENISFPVSVKNPDLSELNRLLLESDILLNPRLNPYKSDHKTHHGWLLNLPVAVVPDDIALFECPGSRNIPLVDRLYDVRRSVKEFKSLLQRLKIRNVPKVWRDRSGFNIHRVSTESGSHNFYFHRNCFTAASDKMVFVAPSGLRLLDLKTQHVSTLSPHPVLHPIVGRNCRKVFYAANQALWSTHLDSKKTEKIAELPSAWELTTGILLKEGQSLLSLNSDESLLVGAACIQPRAPGDRLDFRQRFETKWPMCLYTVEIQTGKLQILHEGNDWFNHIQCSPTDPRLILFCHEGPWHEVQRVWTIHTDGTNLSPHFIRKHPDEIYGHEVFSPDGTAIWCDRQAFKGGGFSLISKVLSSGEEKYIPLPVKNWSVHFLPLSHKSLFLCDGAGHGMVAGSRGRKKISLLKADTKKILSAELVDLTENDYEATEPNCVMSPDEKYLFFRSNLHGPTHLYRLDLGGIRSNIRLHLAFLFDHLKPDLPLARVRDRVAALRYRFFRSSNARQKLP